MSAKVFFDTNVLVYAYDEGELEKQSVARKLIQTYAMQGQMYLSTQVLQEFYVVVTRTKRQLLMPHLAAEIVSDLAEYPLVTTNRQLIQQAMRRHQEGAFSFWDSLIVEAALVSGCETLLSEDMQHGLVVDQRLKIQNPFVTI